MLTQNGNEMRKLQSPNIPKSNRKPCAARNLCLFRSNKLDDSRNSADGGDNAHKTVAMCILCPRIIHHWLPWKTPRWICTQFENSL